MEGLVSTSSFFQRTKIECSEPKTRAKIFLVFKLTLLNLTFKENFGVKCRI